MIRKNISTSNRETLAKHLDKHDVPTDLASILEAVARSAKAIRSTIGAAGLNDILGSFGEVNVQGEEQQKLDVFADQIMVRELSECQSVGILASEERDEPIVFERAEGTADYAVAFDPLDGSSNIDVNVSVGTIFSVMRRPATAKQATVDWLLQPGHDQVAAGYVVYGTSTMLVYTTGKGVFALTLDPDTDEFVVSYEQMMMPWQGKYYSVNEAYRDAFSPEYVEFFNELRSGYSGVRYSARYIGSLVADFHRTLITGGVFVYPPTTDQPEGKLRLLYEVNPMSMLAKQAGGVASNGTVNALDVNPDSIHQRTGLIVGSRAEMELFYRCQFRSSHRPTNANSATQLKRAPREAPKAGGAPITGDVVTPSSGDCPIV